MGAKANQTVHVHRFDGDGCLAETVVVSAGESFPDWVVVGDHVGIHVVSDDPGPVDDDADAQSEKGAPVPGKPAGNASLEAWQEYAKSQGATDGDLDGASRDDLRDLFA